MNKAPTHRLVIRNLKAEGKLPEETIHRQVKYLSNVIEADHCKLKQRIRSVSGFETLKTAYVMICGSGMTRALRKEQAAIWQYGGGIIRDPSE